MNDPKTKHKSGEQIDTPLLAGLFPLSAKPKGGRKN